MVPLVASWLSEVLLPWLVIPAERGLELEVGFIFNWSFGHSKSFDKGLRFIMVLKSLTDGLTEENEGIWLPLSYVVIS